MRTMRRGCTRTSPDAGGCDASRPAVCDASKAMLPREVEVRVRGVQPVSAWQAEAILHCVHPLPSRQAEKQLHSVQPLPAQLAEKQVRGVQRVPPW